MPREVTVGTLSNHLEIVSLTKKNSIKKKKLTMKVRIENEEPYSVLAYFTNSIKKISKTKIAVQFDRYLYIFM